MHVNWQSGEDVIIAPSVSNEEAETIYADGWETVKPYLRKVKQPSWSWKLFQLSRIILGAVIILNLVTKRFEHMEPK